MRHRPRPADRRLAAILRDGSRRRAFTITELLVVIGIIILLIGILLPALARVNQRARGAKTTSIMEEFSKACETFRQEFGFYPGLVPEEILASDPRISSTENALLHLMGGGIRPDDPLFNNPPAAPDGTAWETISIGSGANAYQIKVNRYFIGRGPRVGGKEYPPFFSPRGDEIAAASGQVDPEGALDSLNLPDLIDAWGQPILYVRSIRNVGELVGSVNPGQSANPPRTQFYINGIYPYLNSEQLGELGKSQLDSIIRINTSQRNATLAQIIRHPAMGTATAPQTGSPKGQFVLISPGPDGIFFSRYDGPGTPNAPVTNIVSGANGKPQVVEQYDDLMVFGGG